MDEATLSSNAELVLKTLLKTNRPPTEQEKAIICESMAPTNAKLKDVDTQISETMAYIQELKSQVEQAEIKLQRLQEEKASILETFADHRRVFSPFRNLPEDVLREICMTCVSVNMPTLSYRVIPLPYVLAQICGGLRCIALTTPCIWASMRVRASPYYFPLEKRDYLILARKAREWFERANGLALTIIMEETATIGVWPEEFLSDTLFEIFLSYSAFWKRIEFAPRIREELPSTPIARIAALTAVDVPLLESISLHFPSGASILCRSPILSIPSLKSLKLHATWSHFSNSSAISKFTVNWAVLTSLTISGGEKHDGLSTFDAIASVLRQTRCLEFCDITFDPRSGSSLSEINLPLLKTLCIDYKRFKPTSVLGTPSILDLIKAPILSVLDIHAIFLDISLIEFFKHSTCIRELFLTHLNTGKSLADITKFLRHCPSLYLLNLRPSKWSEEIDSYEGNKFLLAFVEDNGIGVVCPCLQNLNFVAGQTVILMDKPLRRCCKVKCINVGSSSYIQQCVY